MINDLKKWDQNKHFLYNRNHEIFTTQNEVVIVESSTVLPLMALLISILDVITSPQRIKRCATFSAIHSSGESSKWKKKIKIFLKTTRWYIICAGIKNNSSAYNCWYNEKLEFIFFWGGVLKCILVSSSRILMMSSSVHSRR